MSKWTSWEKLPDGDCVFHGDQPVKMKEVLTESGSQVFYKRLKANVEAEKAAARGERLIKSAMQVAEIVRDGDFDQYSHLSREGLIDQIDGLKADLDDAVQVAYNRGADDWTRLNYPEKFERFETEAKELGAELAECNALKPDIPDMWVGLFEDPKAEIGYSAGIVCPTFERAHKTGRVGMKCLGTFRLSHTIGEE